MRLFIGIEVPDALKEELLDTQKNIATTFAKGRFTLPGNHHLTLHFLGEQSKEMKERGIEAMERVPKTGEFSLLLQGLDTFGKPGQLVLYGTVKKTEALFALQEALGEALKRQGFSLEGRPYLPHITLGRNLRLKESLSLKDLSVFWNASGSTIVVTRMVLFESIQREGRLVYIPLHYVSLV